ncbi:MAG TPA: chemotaxis protein CheA [Polyangiaceae bacterium]|nr:chemotaxis protein CheA [Polyangiaceae bacterium]
MPRRPSVTRSLPVLAAAMIQASADEHSELQAIRTELGAQLEGKAGESAQNPGSLLLAQAIEKLDALLAGAPDAPGADALLRAATDLICKTTSSEPPPAHLVSRVPDASRRPEIPSMASMGPREASTAPERPSRAPARIYRRLTLMPEDQDAELVNEFFSEASEHIAAAEAALLTLEAQPDDKAAVNTVFRAFHTVKGVSAMLGMTAVAQLAHHAESLLSRIRDGEIRCTGPYANLCLRGVDMLKETLASVSQMARGQKAEVPEGYFELVDALIHSDSVQAEVIAPAPARLPAEVVAHAEPAIALRASGASAEAPLPSSDRQEQPGAALSPTSLAQIELIPAAHVAPERKATVSKSTGAASAAGALSVATPSAATPSAATPSAATPSSGNGGASDATQDSVRVRTDRLDRLVDMVGELVIAHSMVSQDGGASAANNGELTKKITHVGKIVRDLQDLSMSLRMVPLKPTFQKLTRIARDVARKGNKSLQFLTDGDETEIDRNMVDAIAEPLVHMVRNAADHGIETPERRRQAGKPEQGTIRLSAYHMGGHVMIDLSDDGGGLDRERIVKKAIAKQLITSEKGMSDSDVFQLIFVPGFSTNEAVTDVSGRGVGMDVVRKNIDRLKGRIEISSERGKGTLFSIRLPLTLAITDGMLVRVGTERYIIPTRDISLNFRPEPEQLSTAVGKGEMVMLRGSPLPLFRLHELFGIRDAVEDPCQALVVVLHDGPSACALLVDELLGQQQVVAKSLGPAVGQVQSISGGAILGDGRVGLILDPSSLISLARQRRASGAGPLRGKAQVARMES